MQTLKDFIDEQYFPYAEANLKPRTVVEYRRLADRCIVPKLGGLLLSDVTTAAVERWHLAERKRAPVQANRALAVLSAALRLAARWGLIPVNPARGVSQSKERGRDRFLNKEEIGRLATALEAEAPQVRLFVKMALYTGARPGELLGLEWAWVRREPQWHIRLPDSKTGARTIHLPKTVVSELYQEWRSRAWTLEGRIFSEIEGYRSAWDRIRRSAGLQGVRLYDLRHTFASAAIASRQTLEMVSQLLGHSDPTTTRRYAHLMPEAGNAAAEQTAATIERMFS